MAQNSDDESAAELLKKIAKERAQEIKNGKQKKGKPLPPIKSDELPYEIPESWSLVRIGETSTIERGGSPRPIKSYLTESADGLNWIKIGDTNQGGKYIRSTAEKIRPDGLKKTRMVYPGDFLLTNSMSFGRPYITLIEGCIHDGWLRISPPESLDKDYLYHLLSSPFVHRFFKASAAGAVVQNLNSEKVRALPIPLPPLAEQHRIVAKVDELMALCDQLEQEQESSLDTHDTLVATLLGALTNATADAGQFAEAWQRIQANFDTLFTTESSIDQLKQTILQLAVMGKLVPQDPEDESVEILLTRNDNLRHTVASDDRRASKDNQELLSADDRWEVPNTWTWRGLADTALFVDYRGKTPTKIEAGIRLITAKNVRRSKINLDPEEFISEEEYDRWMTRGFPKVGDVLFTTEAPMGNAAVIELTERFALAQRVICFQIYEAFDPRFLEMPILSEPFQRLLEENGTGMTAKGIKSTKLKRLPVVIPPLAEQHRIVAKVDELMALCDQLKASLATAQTTQLNLADSLVEQAIV